MKDLKRLIPVICSCISMILLSFLIYLNKDFKVEMKSNVINVGDDIEDSFTATFRGYDVTKDVKIKSNVYDTKHDTYQLTFSYFYGKREYEVTKDVEIKDIISPEIILRGGNEYLLKINDNYVEPGYTAIDNYDSNVTDKVTVSGEINNTKVGTYNIVYSVKDSSDNKSEVIRKIHVLEKLPNEMSESEFTLKGLYEKTILKEKKPITDKTMQLYTYIGDKNIALYSTYGLIDIKNIWYNPELKLSNISDTPIIIDGDNTNKPLFDNIVLEKPRAVILYFGLEGYSNIDEFIKDYTNLVINLKNRLNSRIIVMSVNTVSSKSNISVKNINTANYYLAKMCNENNVSFMYANESLTRNEDNFLSDGRTLSKKGMTTIYNYIKSHIRKGD